jgi:RNA recognition motif-containing protein
LAAKNLRGRAPPRSRSHRHCQHLREGLEKAATPDAGTGFVEMATAEEAEEAIARWNGAELDGRRLEVEKAKSAARSAAHATG